MRVLVALVISIVSLGVTGTDAKGRGGSNVPPPDLLFTVSDYEGAYIYVVPLAASRPDAIFEGFDPVWSPDGSWIAFSSYQRAGTPSYQRASTPLASDIYVAKPDGSSLTRLTFGASAGAATSWPAWSPDGARIAYLSQASAGLDVWTVSIAGGPAHRLTSSGGEKVGLAWSPSGGSLLTTRSRTIIDINATTGMETTIARGTEPVWSPDGKRIAYVDGSGRVAVMNADGSASRQLTSLDSQDSAWSPDGTQVAFVGDYEMKPPYGPAGPGTRVDLYTAPADASAPPRRLTGAFDGRIQSSGDSLAQPMFSPDGAFISYVSDVFGTVLVNTDGTCADPLPYYGGPPGLWQPHSVTGGLDSCVDLTAYPYSPRGWTAGEVNSIPTGESANVAIVVENHGNAAAHDVVVHVARATRSGHINGCGVNAAASGACSLGTLAPGSSKTVALTISSATPGKVGLTYLVSSSDNDLPAAATSGAISITVLPCRIHQGSHCRRRR